MCVLSRLHYFCSEHLFRDRPAFLVLDVQTLHTKCEIYFLLTLSNCCVYVRRLNAYIQLFSFVFTFFIAIQYISSNWPHTFISISLLFPLPVLSNSNSHTRIQRLVPPLCCIILIIFHHVHRNIRYTCTYTLIIVYFHKYEYILEGWYLQEPGYSLRRLQRIAGDFLTTLAQKSQCSATGDQGSHRSKLKNGLETFYKTDLRWMGICLDLISKKSYGVQC